MTLGKYTEEIGDALTVEDEYNYDDNITVVISGRMKTFYKGNFCHRDNNKPAFIDKYEGQYEWRQSGFLHRKNGASYVCSNLYSYSQEFYLYGTFYQKHNYFLVML